MPVRRDERGRWRYQKVVQLFDGTNVRISGTPTLNTKVAAEEAEREHIHRVLHPVARNKEVPGFAKFVEERWLPTYPGSVGNRPSSVREKKIHVRLHLTPWFGHRRLDQIKGEVVDRFFSDLRKKKFGKAGKTMSAKSIKNIGATLRRILASAVEWGDLAAVPVLPRVKVPDSSWDFLAKGESDRLIDAGRDAEEKAILMFAVHTGARAGEEIALEWGDIDWHNGLVVFRRSSTRGDVGPTKSGRERKVPLTGQLTRALKAIKHLRGPLVFCDRDGKPLKLDHLHERLWGACRRAGLRRIRWHDLRHTFGSQAATAGVPLLQVQHWMGHSTITMTMRYAHLGPGGGREYIHFLETGSVHRANVVQNGSVPLTDPQ